MQREENEKMTVDYAILTFLALVVFEVLLLWILVVVVKLFVSLIKLHKHH